MSKAKKLLKFLSNPWLYILLYFVASLIAMGLFSARPVKKIVVNIFKQETKTDSSKKIKQKINLSEGDYFSAGYSINTNDKEKTITTAGIICILPNGNILHVIMTGENIGGRMKDIEETIGFLTKHQDEIFDDMARTIVEAGQKSPPLEPEKESPSQNNKAIKKKV